MGLGWEAEVAGIDSGQRPCLFLLFFLLLLTASGFLRWLRGFCGLGPGPHCLAVPPFQDTLLFLTVGDEKGAGLFLLAGPPETVETLGPR